MNFMDRNMRGPATIRYLDGDYKILTPGTHVVCAVTGQQILLEDLRYWNVDLQEAYVDAEAAMKRFRETQGR
jgi:hypothetical protein